MSVSQKVADKKNLPHHKLPEILMLQLTFIINQSERNNRKLILRGIHCNYRISYAIYLTNKQK